MDDVNRVTINLTLLMLKWSRTF